MADWKTLLAPHPRVRLLVQGAPVADGSCVLYWMQRAQRAKANPALNLAIALGNSLKLPVWAVFGLTPSYPEAQRRHYRFLIEGLVDTQADAAQLGVPLVVRLGDPPAVVLKAVEESRPAVVVGDENPVRIGQCWRAKVAESLSQRARPIPFPVVDADVVVPSSLFPKEEYAARTIRPKIHRVLHEWLKPLPVIKAKTPWPTDESGQGGPPQGEPITVEHLMGQIRVGGVGEVPNYPGGTREAERRLQRFVAQRLARYGKDRNEPIPYMTSELSAHLHFGHISPLTIALAVQKEAEEAGVAAETKASVESYLEEMIVRRELAINFVARNPKYDSLAGCPDWARATLAKHANDPRPKLYTATQLERAETHDPLWNAAQKEMTLTGRMHNYLRMYWAKKILEWSPDPETAFAVALDLNDRYEMDGRDPNGYTGVAWAIGGKHDRPWSERPIFGTVRYMSYDSTRRKFDSERYIAYVRGLERGGSLPLGD